MCFLLAAMATGCAGRADVEPLAGPTMICVDGLAVDPGRSTLLDVLSSRASMRRWVSADAPELPGRLVLVDGIEVDGLSRLATIGARDVRSVEIVEPDRAVPEFGSRGAAGAILVRTQAAARRDRTNAGSRPPERCQ